MKQEMVWRKKDIQKLTTYVRKFNASITKLTKANHDIASAGLLPEKLSVEKIRSQELSRKDFNIIISRIDRWFKPKARDVIVKGGLQMTRWEFNEVRYAEQRVNYQKKKRLEKSTRNLRRKGQLENKVITTAQKLADIEKRLKEPNPEGIYEFEEAYQSWESFKKRMFMQSSDKYREEQEALYYYNYNKAIYQNFNDDHARAISWRLEDFQLSGGELYEIIGDYPELDIDFMYDPDAEEEKFQYWMELFPQAVAKWKGEDVAMV